MSLHDPEHDPIRADIVHAARKRFLHYGFVKTNLNEIASDVNMSASNLYRYFENKHEIGLACCVQLINERMQQLRDITQNPELTAAERLQIYALSNLSHSQYIASDPTHNNELIALITTGCSELIHKKFTQQLNILSTILLHGNQTGEFNVTNVHDMAKSIHTALLVLDMPDVIPIFSDSAWKARVLALIECLLNGLLVEQ